jgi:hypothetical protein
MTVLLPKVSTAVSLRMIARRVALCDTLMASMIVIAAVGALANAAYQQYRSGKGNAANVVRQTVGEELVPPPEGYAFCI